MSKFKLAEKLGYVSPFEEEDSSEDILVTSQKWQSLIYKCRPHEVFNLEWNSYDPIKFADTFLPKVEGYQGKGVRFYDGASLLNGLRPSPRTLLPLTDSNELIATIAFSMPKGVEASKKKNRIQPRKNEVVAFIEIDQFDNATVSFKFGQSFKNYLTSNKITPNSIENKSFVTDIENIQKHFNNTLSHENMMNFVLEKAGIDPEKAYGNTKKGKLETYLKKNKIQSFIYKNVCKDGTEIAIQGTIVKGHLQLKYINASEIESISKLNIQNKKEVIIFKYDYQLFGQDLWTQSALTIPSLFNEGSCPDTQKPIEQAEIDHVSDLVSEHITHTKRKGTEKQYFELNNIIQKQLNNPFYDEVNLCVNLTIEENNQETKQLQPFDGNQTVNLSGVFGSGSDSQNLNTNTYTSSFKKNDKPCGISLDIRIDASGEVSIKHKANPNYLKEYESKWDKEIKARGLENEIDIQELREQVLQDFESAEVEHGFFKRHIQNIEAYFNENIGGYIEAIQATQKVVVHVWDEGKVNEGIWHSTGEDREEYEKFPEYMNQNATIAGVEDGVVDEIVGIPMAIKSIYGLATDEKQREALEKIFTKEGFSQMIQGLSSEVDSIRNDSEKLEHFSGQTTISVATMFFPGMQITKVGKLNKTLDVATDGLKQLTNPKVLEVLENLRKTNRYKPEILKAIEDFMKELDPKLLGKIADKAGFDEVLKEMAQQWKKFHGSKFMFKHLDGKGDDFIAKIKEFESKIIDKLNFTADVRLIDGGFLEYKSWKKATFSLLSDNQAQKQLKNYLKSGKFEYVIDKAKLLKDAVPDPSAFVKGKFQKVFQKNADEWFKAIENGGKLIDQKKLMDLFDTIDLDEIKDIIDDINSDFYKKIIKVE